MTTGDRSEVAALAAKLLVLSEAHTRLRAARRRALNRGEKIQPSAEERRVGRELAAVRAALRVAARKGAE